MRCASIVPAEADVVIVVVNLPIHPGLLGVVALQSRIEELVVNLLDGFVAVADVFSHSREKKRKAELLQARNISAFDSQSSIRQTFT